MECIREFLIGPFGPVFRYFVLAFIGSLFFWVGWKLIDLKNTQYILGFKRIIGTFLLALGINNLLRVVLYAILH